MNPDSLEQKLSRQQMRQVPPEWRDEVLAAAREASISRHPSPATRHSLFSILNQQLSNILWPHPRAWGALAAVWLVIFALNVVTRDDSTTTTARQAVVPSPQMRQMLREQEQLLAELFDEPVAADRTKARLPRPQSSYRHEFLNA